MTNEARQAGASEIEVTEEMIAAGVEAYCHHDHDCGTVSELLIEVFRVMMKAAPTPVAMALDA